MLSSPPAASSSSITTTITSPPPPPSLMDILSLEPLAPYFEHLWHRMRPVSRAASRWAMAMYEARLASLEEEFISKTERCKRLVSRRVYLFGSALDDSSQMFLIETMVILTGTAALVQRVLLMEARGGTEGRHAANCVRTLGDILDRTCTSADFGVLIQVPMPLNGRLQFAHIREMMTMVGELRTVIAPQNDRMWCFSECGVDDASDAYARLQMHRWAWPDIGLAFHWTQLDI